ncbi:AAA family ATPase [Butyricimonas synergistica]|uniref:AAA family ATPase n=1 Tax=Butyricimonas synergistica TaxID=544644 RepID=UPI00036F8523|nr:MoxR family ATPase [Butyricimonas synergistica]
MEDQINFESRIDFTSLHEKVARMREQMGKVIVGQREVADLLLTAMLADGHILIEGVPGIAKTFMAKVMARLLDVSFSRIQFTPDLMPSDILGTSVFIPATGRFEYRKGPIFSNIVLVDEINRAPAKTQAALFEVMEERQITNDGTEYKMDYPFVVVGTQNPIEHEGTYRLPEAQLDRFLFKINVTYPSVEEEIKVLELHDRGAIKDWNTLEPVLSADMLRELRKSVSQVVVDPKIKTFIVNIVYATRKSGWLYLGASPRASIALMNGAKAFAAIQGRDFVVPDDVLQLAAPVLRHRVQLSSEKELEGVTVDQVVQQIVSKIEVPR